MDLLELKNVTLKYKAGFSLFGDKSKTAIESLDLTIRQGENLGIIGGNGAGKSSLLKMIAGIYNPDKGKIITHKPIRSTFIGLQSGFIPYLNGLQNITLTGLLLGMTRKEIKAKLSKIVEYSELERVINQPVFTYSSGMKARLAFSVSVFSDPDLLLIDEAMGVGDKEFRKKSNDTLKEMINGDSAVVLVSHETNYIKKNCNKLLWIESGKLVEYGACNAVLENYQF